jgi:hypothetical protein
MRWQREGAALVPVREREREIPGDIAEAVDELKRIERPGWQEGMRRLEESGDYTAARQYFRELLGEPPIVNQTTVAAAADTILWDAASLTPIPANSIQAGQTYKVTAWGITTTAVTGSQTVILNPRFGTTTGGTALGVSRTQPVNAIVKTNIPWHLQMWVHFRTIGSAGTATCGGFLVAESIIGTAATTNTAPVAFGTGATTATTVNTTVAAGLVVTITPSLSTQTYTTMGVVLESLN